jgi:tRNA-dihydrouridine synthase 1
MLTRSYLDPQSSKSLLAYTPMLHARLFSETQKFRDAHFQSTQLESGSQKPWLDGNPSTDRPLFVQFCANKPEELLEAARHVEPYCDAVDLNLGCPQGIAKSGHYGAFLQGDWKTIYSLINKLYNELSIPVTAKMRILETKERTLEYAKMILSAGASIITVHGRRREQKGHNMGTADWSYIRYLRDNLPRNTVIFANGNILNRYDVGPCLEATGADAVMSAEGNLSDPTIFAKPPLVGQTEREYWRGRNGQEGYRIDGVIRRYMDIIYQHVLATTPPKRSDLYLPGDQEISQSLRTEAGDISDDGGPPMKKRKKEQWSKLSSPSLKAIQGHLFQLLRPMLSTHTEIRDALAKCRVGDICAFEHVLDMIEDAVKIGLQEYENEKAEKQSELDGGTAQDQELSDNAVSSSRDTIARYKRPWWICQPHIRPLPEEALRTGALKLSKQELAKAEVEKEASNIVITRGDSGLDQNEAQASEMRPELPRPALVCG